MNHELLIYGKDLDIGDIRKQCFDAIDRRINYLVLPVCYIGQIREFTGPHTKISALIDFPSGLGDTKVREHAVMNAVKKGVDAVDVVANLSLLQNGFRQKFREDFKSIFALCQNHLVDLRVLLEYRLFTTDFLKLACEILNKIGIEYVLPATGLMVDDYVDNLLAGCDMVQNTSINLITNGNIYTKQHYENIINASKNSNFIYGIRFNNIRLIKELFKL